jgi:hypothetical protein
MEKATPPTSISALSAEIASQRGAASGGFVLTDSVVEELKRQSANGCLLCSLETLDEEEWD